MGIDLQFTYESIPKKQDKIWRKDWERYFHVTIIEFLLIVALC